MPERLTTRSPQSVDPAAARTPLLLPPLNAVLELGLFVAVIAGLEWLVPSFDLLRVEPNPCWLPVLLLSVQYGTVSGLLAAAVCVGLSMQIGFPDQEVGENLFVYLLRAWAQPMLWIGAAVLLGQFRTRHIVERAELRHELATMSSQRTAIAAYASNLRARCDALERHIAGRDGPEAIGLLALLARVGGGSAGELADNFRTCLAGVLPGARATLVRVGPGGLELLASTTGTRTGLGLPQGLDAGTPLVRDLIARRRPVSVLTAEGERLLASHGLLAVPVEVADQVAAFILVEEIEPQALTPTLPDALAVIGAALAPGLAALSGGPAQPQAGEGVADAQPTAPQLWLKRLWRPWQRDRQAKVAASAVARPDVPPRRRVR